MSGLTSIGGSDLKNLLATLALVAFASTASAGTTAFVGYDYNAKAGGSGSTQEVAAGVAVDTKIGRFDGALVGNRYRAAREDDSLGFEVGYSNGVKLAAGNLAGRVGFGRKNQIDCAGGGFKGNLQYYTLGAEFTAPLTSNLGGFVGYQHKNGTNTVFAENRVSAGVDLALSKNASARVGYAYTTCGGLTFNGVTTALAYQF